jgi:hypothetical protein
MADSAPDTTVDTLDHHLQAYHTCREDAARLESYTWITAALFGVASAAGLAFTVTLASRVPPLHYARLAVAVMTAFELNASLVWWRFVRRWWHMQRLASQRMDALEAELGFRPHRPVDSGAEPAGGAAVGRNPAEGGHLPAILFFLRTNALLWSVLLLAEVFGHALLWGALLVAGELVLYHRLWKAS